MLTHDQIWTALDRLAERAGLSASGLAKRGPRSDHLQQVEAHHATAASAGPRPNPSPRRWPPPTVRSTTFVQLIDDSDAHAVQSVPLLGFAEAGAGGYFDDGGFPVGKGWDEVGASLGRTTSTPMRWRSPAIR